MQHLAFSSSSCIFVPPASLSQTCWKLSDAQKLHLTTQTKKHYPVCGNTRYPFPSTSHSKDISLSYQNPKSFHCFPANCEYKCIWIQSPKAFDCCRYSQEINKTFHWDTIISYSQFFDHQVHYHFLWIQEAWTLFY